MEQLLGIIIGSMSGFVWEKISTSPYQNFSTFIPSLIVKTSGPNIHLHHWLAYLVVLISLSLWSYKTGRLTHPAYLMVAAFLVAAILCNWNEFPDEYKFIQ